MATTATTGTRATAAPAVVRARTVLSTLFTVAPIAFGVDKLAGLLTDRGPYRAPGIDDIVPGSAHDAMLMVGVGEVATPDREEAA